MTTRQLTPEQREAARERIADLQSVMSTDAGRRFIWRLLGECGTFHTGWSPSAEIHLRAGMRSIGLAVYADVHAHCFEQYQAMEREARDAEMIRSQSTNEDEES